MTLKKILLADDSQIFRKLQGTYLKSQPYELIFAENGRDALHKVNTIKPDLVILDLMMPEMEGDIICRIMKRTDHLKHIPVIMVTSHGNSQGETRCRNAGCDVFLTKPIERSSFMAAIQKLTPTEPSTP